MARFYKSVTKINDYFITREAMNYIKNVLGYPLKIDDGRTTPGRVVALYMEYDKELKEKLAIKTRSWIDVSNNKTYSIDIIDLKEVGATKTETSEDICDSFIVLKSARIDRDNKQAERERAEDLNLVRENQFESYSKHLEENRNQTPFLLGTHIRKVNGRIGKEPDDVNLEANEEGRPVSTIDKQYEKQLGRRPTLGEREGNRLDLKWKKL